MEGKNCLRCQQFLSLCAFSKGKEKDGLQSWCKSCAAVYYKENREKIYPQIRERRKQIEKKARDLIWEFFLAHPCVDCGETDPIVLEFDHVRDKKLYNVATIMQKTGSIRLLQEEIAKCDSRCANCHRRKTARDLGWWKDFV